MEDLNSVSNNASLVILGPIRICKLYGRKIINRLKVLNHEKNQRSLINHICNNIYMLKDEIPEQNQLMVPNKYVPTIFIIHMLQKLVEARGIKKNFQPCVRIRDT